MSHSILNSARSLLNKANTIEVKNLNESVASFAHTLRSQGASKEYVNAALKRISFANNQSQLNEAIDREVLKLKTATYIREDESEDLEGKGAEDAEGKSEKLNRPVGTGDAEETLKKKQNDEEQDQKEIAEHLSALFSGEDLSPAFKNKAAAIFEAAVNARVERIQAELVRQSRDVVVEETVVGNRKLVEKIDQYLDYVVKNWLSENRLAVENGISNELSESFMGGLQKLFETHYVDVPKSKVNIVNKLSGQVNQLTEQLNRSLQENMLLKQTSTKSNCNTIVESLSRGLAATQAAKFKSLVRGISYGSEQEFAQKAQTIREQYFSPKQNIRPLQMITETNPSSAPIPPSPKTGAMAAYFNTIGRLEDAKTNNTQS